MDLNVLNWSDIQKDPVPDFNSYHQCRDFDTIEEWRKQNAVDLRKVLKIKKPKGVKTVPTSPKFYEAIDNTDLADLKDFHTTSIVGRPTNLEIWGVIGTPYEHEIEDTSMAKG
jgi:hypothetical protein